MRPSARLPWAAASLPRLTGAPSQPAHTPLRLRPVAILSSAGRPANHACPDLRRTPGRQDDLPRPSRPPTEVPGSTPPTRRPECPSTAAPNPRTPRPQGRAPCSAGRPTSGTCGSLPPPSGSRSRKTPAGGGGGLINETAEEETVTEPWWWWGGATMDAGTGNWRQRSALRLCPDWVDEGLGLGRRHRRVAGHAAACIYSSTPVSAPATGSYSLLDFGTCTVWRRGPSRT